MRFRRFTPLLIVLVLVACDESTTTTTQPDAERVESPQQAVEALISALAEGDWQATEGLVDETQVALLTAIEGVPAPEAAEMLRAGLPPAVRANFWQAFANGFEQFSEEAAADVLVGSPSEFVVEAMRFGSVQVSLRHQAGVGAWITRQVGDDWRVDLLATFGPSVASPLREWLAEVPDDEDGRLIRTAVAAQEPSFMVALSHQPLGEISDGARFEVQLLMIEARG